MRRIIGKENAKGKKIKAIALLTYLLPVRNSITFDETLKNFIIMAQKYYYNEIQDLLQVSKVEGFELIRLGKQNDGGYILLDDFESGSIAYSFGICDDVSWDKDIAKRGYNVFMYDHTIEKLPEEDSHFHFFKNGIADGEDKDERLKTLEYFIKQNHHENEKNMILKMDVEGAEWGFLEAVSSETLKQFSQMTFEFHNVHRNKNPERVLNVFRKLNRTHKIIHIHANNNGNYIDLNGKKICDLFELSYVLRDKYKFLDSYDVNLPLNIDALNIPNNPEIELGRWNAKINIHESPANSEILL